MGRKQIFIIALFFIIASVLLISLKMQKNRLPLAKEKNFAGSAAGLLAQAKGLELKGELLEAKAVYQRLVGEFSNSAEVANWQKKIEEANIRLLFSSAVTPRSILYEIKPGENLTKIAKDFKTTAELIKKSNNLADDIILPGRKLKIWAAPFSIVVDKSQNTLLLKTDEEVLKTYVVSTGKNNSTPAGNFKIINKLPNPTWFKAGAVVPVNSPDNILGTRWLGFDLAGYGIHGTTEPQSLGKQVTQGCVRMSNADVEELYTIVPVGTEVVIVD